MRKHKEISFDVTAAETATIRKIVNRAGALFVGAGQSFDKLGLTMDITAAHANGCQLDLDRLLAADDFNFLHDVVGIERHLDRKTGELQNFFLPRFAKNMADA